MPTPTRKVTAFGFKSVMATLVVAGWMAIAPASAQINNISQVDQRIVEAYGTDHVNQLIAEEPQQLEYLEFYLDNSYYLFQHRAKPGGDIPMVSEVAKNTQNKAANQIALPNPSNFESFNALLWEFEIHPTKRAVYGIDGTDQVLMFYSEKELTAKFNAFKASNQ